MNYLEKGSTSDQRIDVGYHMPGTEIRASAHRHRSAGAHLTHLLDSESPRSPRRPPEFSRPVAGEFSSASKERASRRPAETSWSRAAARSPAAGLLLTFLGALCVLAPMLLLPVAAEAQTTVWSGTLTVRDSVGLLGCSNGFEGSYCSVYLSPDEFTHDSTDYAIKTFWVRTNGKLELHFDTDLTTATQALTLNVDGTAFAFEDADDKSAPGRNWNNSGLSWTVGDTVSATLTEGTTTLSTDATLSALALSGVTLSPTFVSSTETYTATVVNSVIQTTVTATTTHSGATVAFKDGDDNALTNPVTLAVGDNVIKAVVTAQDTTTMKTYMVTVTRAGTTTTAPEIVTGGVQVTSTPMATADTYGLGETIEITVTFDNAVTVDASSVGPPRIQFRLDGGVNKWAEYSRGSGGTALVFTYTVQSGDMDANGIWLEADFLRLQMGTISAAADNTVNATLTYAEPGLQPEHKVDGSLTTTDATLSALALSGVTLDQTFVSSTETYTATVGNSVTETTVTATPTHPGATVAFKDGDNNALTNPVTLAVGDNVIKAVVTAQDTTTMKTYMVTVTREGTDKRRSDLHGRHQYVAGLQRDDRRRDGLDGGEHRHTGRSDGHERRRHADLQPGRRGRGPVRDRQHERPAADHDRGKLQLRGADELRRDGQGRGRQRRFRHGHRDD